MDKLNKIAAIEKAIAEKYGKEATKNPKADWDEEKEADYQRQQKELLAKKRQAFENSQKVEYKGFLISKKLVRDANSARTCPVCNKFSFKACDDVYMTRYKCCYDCYYQYVEGREERWEKGWRPNLELQKNDSKNS